MRARTRGTTLDIPVAGLFQSFPEGIATPALAIPHVHFSQTGMELEQVVTSALLQPGDRFPA